MSRSLVARHTAVRVAVALSITALAARADAKPCPNMMLVLDQSASMAQDPNGYAPGDPMFQGPSKWEMLQQVIVDVVKQYGDRVPFGLELFSTNAWRDAQQCENAAMITVALAHSAAPQIISAVQAAKPYAETNTGEAVKRAAQDPSLQSATKPNFIVLVTDGNPNCNPLDARDVALGDYPEYTQMQMEAAAAQSPSVKTFVIGFDGSTGVNKDVLDAMAGWGGERVSGCQGNRLGTPCYYRAGANADAFKAVLDDIITEAGGGEFSGSLCDDSCFSNKCATGQVCVTTESNPEPHCEPDTCAAKNCSGDQFCRDGQCVGACTGGCPTGKSCKDGQCVADPCGGKTCATGQVCNPKDGSCIAPPCPMCIDGKVCDVASGACVADECRIVKCPGGTVCVFNGQCTKPPGSGGCDAGGGVPENRRPLGGVGIAAMALLLVAMAMAMRRKRSA